MSMETEFCLECEEPMILVERANGEKLVICQSCGINRSENGADLVQTAEGEPSTFCFSGQGAKPQGYKYEKYRASAVKKKAQSCLDLLCQNFNIPINLKKEMEGLMEHAKLQRQHNAVVGAIFLAVLREQQELDSSVNKPTLRQVATALGLRMSKIAAAIKQMQSFLETNHHTSGSGAITCISGLIKSVVPSVKLYDPLLPEVEVTDRVLGLTEKIIALIQRRCTRSIEPNLITIASHFLAWQSCFFYQHAYHGSVSMSSVTKPGKVPSLQEYSNLMKLDRGLLIPVKRSYAYVLNELAVMLNKMPWVVKKPKISPKNQVPEHLEAILQFQEVTCEVLSAEAEIKRRDENPVLPVIPRELTAEEEAALEAPELTENDLPDSELTGYLRSEREICALKNFIETSSSESED